jgi:endonuclease/exonuclease/phosphatase family metal-dependent hydrolase
MKSLLRVAFLSVACVAALSCSSSDSPPPQVAVVNFNAGLATGYVDYAAERQPLIGPAIAALDADVVCLQEVWSQEAADAILAATASAFPYHYLEVTKGEEGGGGTPACTVDEVQPLKACVEANCGGVAPGELAGCAVTNCKDKVDALPSACTTCIAANIGKAIDEILGACTTSSASYTYDGRNGLLLLSRHPLSGTEYKRLDSYLIVRVVLHAVVATPTLGSLDVFCTHLTADLGASVKYAGKAASWGAEQGAQIDVMTAWVAERATAHAGLAVVLGDTNCGPAHDPGVTAAFPENHAKFAAAGWADPYGDDPATPCTFCGANPLVGDDTSELIDHAFVVGAVPTTEYEATRVLDQPVTLTIGGAPVESRLSDHYGVRVVVRPPTM